MLKICQTTFNKNYKQKLMDTGKPTGSLENVSNVLVFSNQMI